MCQYCGCWPCQCGSGSGSYTAPTVAQFQAQFIRDFKYGTDPSQNVIPQDITNAFNIVDFVINPALWTSQTSYVIGYNLLAAHYLVITLRASTQGLSGQWNWAQNNKSVGQVSEGFTIPERIIANPEFMALTKTSYGAQYLMLVLPQLTGQVFSVYGGTRV